jgi:predicted ATPase
LIDACHAIELRGNDLRSAAFERTRKTSSNSVYHDDNRQLEASILQLLQQIEAFDHTTTALLWREAIVDVGWQRQFTLKRTMYCQQSKVNVALCRFEELCDVPLASSDYSALARQFTVVVVLCCNL